MTADLYAVRTTHAHPLTAGEHMPRYLAWKLAVSRQIASLNDQYEAVRKEDEKKQFERETCVRQLEQEKRMRK